MIVKHLCIPTTNTNISSPPRPYTNHATYFSDGGLVSKPKDHAITVKRMFLLHSHFLFRQLPYPVRWNSRAISENIEILADGEWIKDDDWKHFPSDLINHPDDSSLPLPPNLEE